MAPVTVVGEEFVVPSRVGLEILRKHGNYYVADSDGNIIFIVKGHEFSMHNRHELLDASGRTLMTLRKKKMSIFRPCGVFSSVNCSEISLIGCSIGHPHNTNGVFQLNDQLKVLSMHDRWQAFRGESTDENDMLFTVKKSSAIQLKTKLHVYLGKTANDYFWDFCLKCNWSRDCVIYAGNTDNMVAKMCTNSITFTDVWTTKDHFDVTVYPNIDYSFIVALIVILDATAMMYGTRAKNLNSLSGFIGAIPINKIV